MTVAKPGSYYRFEGQALRSPLPAFAPPAGAHWAWHRKEVFKHPGRSTYAAEPDALPMAAEEPGTYGD
jgi:hypothetical protein